MSDKESAAAKKEKACLDNECIEAWNKLPPEFGDNTKEFIYCPYCSEELHLQCSVCKETLTSKDFKYCPWCGTTFED